MAFAYRQHDLTDLTAAPPRGVVAAIEFCELRKGVDNTPVIGIVKGIASSDAKDLDDDIVEQDGLVWAEYAPLHWNHPMRRDRVVGHVTQRRRITKGGHQCTYVEGALLLTNPLAMRIWESGKRAQERGDPAAFGFSIEGDPLEARPLAKGRTHWVKSRVASLALTPGPRNPTCEARIIKGLIDEVESLVLPASALGGHDVSIAQIARACPTRTWAECSAAFFRHQKLRGGAQ